MKIDKTTPLCISQSVISKKKLENKHIIKKSVIGEDKHVYINITLPANTDGFVPVIFQNTCCDSY